MGDDPLRELTRGEVEIYDRDGVVCAQAMPWAARSFPRSSPIPSRRRVRGVPRGPSHRIRAA